MDKKHDKKAPAATGAGQLTRECKPKSDNNTCNLQKEGDCNVIRVGNFSIPNNHHIFPLQDGMKIPRSGSAGFKDAIPAEDAAYRWSNIFKGNVGLYPGPSGILVIDVDTKAHKDGSLGVGIETMKNLQRLHGKLPITFTVKTPSGGFHLYYQKPKIIRVGNNKIGKDVDIRCDGGYVLEPGSIVSGKAYTIIKDIPLATLPDTWVKLFKPGRNQRNSSADLPEVSRDKVTAALEYIPADIDYDTWIRVLAALQSECYEDLAHSWSARSPQYSASEVTKKLSSFTASGGVGVGTIIHIAKKYGYLPTARRKKPNLKHTAGTLEWKGPETIPNALLPVLPFNTLLLPKVFQCFSEDVTDRMQCPVEYVAVILMAGLGGVIGKKCSIFPKKNDNWCVVANLWAALIGRPSAMKSPAMTAAQSGVTALISEARKEYTHKLTQFEKAKMIYDAEKDSIKIHIRNAIKNNQDPSSIAMPEKPDKPVEKRYMTNAGSVERLIKLLEQNPEGIIQSRDELTGWLRSMDSSNSQDARAFYIESWNGAGSSFSYDTVTHGHLFCETGPCVSVMGTIQPGPLSQIVASADRGDMGDDGLLQRFQLMVYPDKALSWQYRDRQPDKIASNAMKNVFKIVALLSGELRFDEQAQPIFINWYSDLMLRTRNEPHPGLESHMSKYPQLMPSLALLIHIAEFASTLDNKQCDINNITIPPVSEEAASKATEWCKYLESHARRIYAMGGNAGVDAAKTLLQRAVDGKLPNPFKACEVQRKKWTGLSQSWQIKQAIELLETYGWAKVEIIQTGGRPSIVCHIHPDAKKHIKNASGIRD